MPTNKYFNFAYLYAQGRKSPRFGFGDTTLDPPPPPPRFCLMIIFAVLAGKLFAQETRGRVVPPAHV